MLSHQVSSPPAARTTRGRDFLRDMRLACRSIQRESAPSLTRSGSRSDRPCDRHLQPSPPAALSDATAFAALGPHRIMPCNTQSPPPVRALLPPPPTSNRTALD